MITSFDMIRLCQQTVAMGSLTPSETHSARVKGFLSAWRTMRREWCEGNRMTGLMAYRNPWDHSQVFIK